MTIRRHVDLAAINSDYIRFEAACEETPELVKPVADTARILIGEVCDDLLNIMKNIGLSVCNCDGIREIEVLMFDMLERSNPGLFTVSEDHAVLTGVEG